MGIGRIPCGAFISLSASCDILVDRGETKEWVWAVRYIILSIHSQRHINMTYRPVFTYQLECVIHFVYIRYHFASFHVKEDENSGQRKSEESVVERSQKFHCSIETLVVRKTPYPNAADV